MTDELLDADQLVAGARGATGLDDLGEDSWQEGLDRLLHSLQSEADLSETGRYVAAGMLTGFLAARLRVTDWHTRHPEIGAAPMPAPIVVVGQPRTGTTILHDLLAQDPRLRAPLTWEVDDPHPPPETATFHTDPRIAANAARGALTEQMNPGFQAIHPSGPQRAQECVSITAGDFRSLLYPTVFRVPSYARWLVYEADHAPAYRYHRKFLQLLQWRHPGERWVLKTPAHLWTLGDLFAAYPDAAIIHTHRDPLKVIASVASLTYHLQQLASDHTSIPVNGAEWAEYLIEGNDRSIAARDDGTVPSAQAVDLLYRDLMADPFAAIAEVYDRLGLTYTPQAEEGMRAFLRDNAADKHGVHRYTFSATELDEAALRARTRRYEERFAVPQEALG